MHKFRSILILALLLTACAPTAMPATPVIEPVETTPIVELTETPILWATNTPTQTDAEKAANTRTPLPPTTTATPGIQPPACTFPLAQTTMGESQPEKYTFSEPKIVSNSNAGIEIVEWLPDSQRVLITRAVQNTPNENIELFNPQTGKTHTYAVHRANMGIGPAWIEKTESIIYSDWFLVSTPTYNKGMLVPSSVVGRQQLWLTSGDPASAQMLEDVQYSSAVVPHEWISSSLAVKPDGNQIVYLKSTGEIPWTLYSRMVSQDGLKAEQQSALQGNYGGEGVWLVSDKMSWRPGTSQIFFYSYASETNQTFLFDIDTQQICALNFGGWVYMARWSPDGQYLAVIKSQGAKFPMSYGYDLVVLDTKTGKLYSIDSTKVGPPEMKDCCMHFVEDVAWAPDNRHLAIIGDADFSGTGTHIRYSRLYLVDFLSGDVYNLFPSYEMISNHFGSGLAWSPDGSKLLATCPTKKEGRLCLISVQRAGQ